MPTLVICTAKTTIEEIFCAKCIYVPLFPACAILHTHIAVFLCSSGTRITTFLKLSLFQIKIWQI